METQEMIPGARRYYYKRMTSQQFSAALDELGLTLGQFARICGTAHKRVDGWLKGTEDIPHSTFIICGLLALPGGLDRAKQMTDLMVYRKDEGDAE